MNKKYTITPFKCGDEKYSKSIFPFPLPLRCLILGKSGSGKTTVLWNIITKYWVDYKNLYIFTKSIDQPIYDNLKEIFEEDLNEIETHFYDSCDDIISVDDCKPNSLVIFDDCLLEKQEIIKEYFVRSRPKNISCIYLSQNYSLVDLQVIRTNLNFTIIFEQGSHYVKKIWEDLIGSDKTLEEFKNLCNKSWKNKHGFVSIDLKDRRYYNMLNVTSNV